MGAVVDRRPLHLTKGWNAQIKELLTGYGPGPIAGIWLDGIGIPLSGDKSLYRCPELYAMIRGIQPQALISYKKNGDRNTSTIFQNRLNHKGDRHLVWIFGEYHSQFPWPILHLVVSML